MICKQCSNLIGLPAEWPPHGRMDAQGSSRTRDYVASSHQKLYACRDCETVLRRGRNTGWMQAAKPADPIPPAPVAPLPGPA